jgi:hypothetical protein
MAEVHDFYAERRERRPGQNFGPVRVDMAHALGMRLPDGKGWDQLTDEERRLYSKVDHFAHMIISLEYAWENAEQYSPEEYGPALTHINDLYNSLDEETQALVLERVEGIKQHEAKLIEAYALKEE